MAAATGTVVISQTGSNFDSADFPRFVLGDGTNSLTFVIDNDARGLKLAGGGDADGYSSASDLPRVLNGLGVAIISTSKGIMTDKKARKDNIGGEVICHVY